MTGCGCCGFVVGQGGYAIKSISSVVCVWACVLVRAYVGRILEGLRERTE